jgi:hypothetical protein
VPQYTAPMSRTGRLISALRPATLVASGAFAVHQLSYLVGGAHASHASDAAGHTYLEALLPLLAVLVGLSVAATVEGGIAGGASSRRRSPVARAFAYGVAILAVFVVQELGEGLLVDGGVEVLLSPVGFVAIPLALGFGLLAWLAARALEAVECQIAARLATIGHGPASSSARPPWLALVLSPAAQAAGAAPRAPPSI